MLQGFKATELGAIVVRETVKRAGIEPEAVDEVIMGCVIQAGLGQNPARQAALNGGLPNTVSAVTINKVCGSGLKAVMMAAQGIQLGDTDIVVAGGMESMSNAPYLLPKAREGYRLGNGTLVDSMINDGLWCAFDNQHMGCTGEVVAERFHVSRAEQDEYATQSHRRAAAAIKAGKFKDEIVPIEIPQRTATSSIPTRLFRRHTVEVWENQTRVRRGTVTRERPGVRRHRRGGRLIDRAREIGVEPMARIWRNKSALTSARNMAR